MYVYVHACMHACMHVCKCVGILWYAMVCLICYGMLWCAMVWNAMERLRVFCLVCYGLLWYAIPWYATLCFAMWCYSVLCLCFAMLCYVLLCFAAMLCDAMLFYAMLCRAVPCYAILCYVLLCYAMYVCMYACMHVWTYVHMYICMHPIFKLPLKRPHVGGFLTLILLKFHFQTLFCIVQLRPSHLAWPFPRCLDLLLLCHWRLWPWWPRPCLYSPDRKRSITSRWHVVFCWVCT